MSAVDAASGPTRGEPALPRGETIAVAGARGFVGRALVAALSRDNRVIALTRSDASARHAQDDVTWRSCDLYRMQELERALEGATRAVYLVHSMQPSARLVQGSFADLDLLLADNFARAAERVGVEQIVYVGGLLPRGDEASPHLRSRAEVAEALGGRRPRLSALRAGIIVGRRGPSIWIVRNLVRRLPFMVLPSWTLTRSQPVALCDVVRAIQWCLGDPERFEGSFDIGGPDVLTYREMMQRTARALGRRVRMLEVDAFSPRLSTLWVQVFGSAPAALVAPLVRSLEHDLVAAPNPLQDALLQVAQGFDRAIASAVVEDEEASSEPVSLVMAPAERARMREARRVRSVQRLPMPAGRDAAWAAEEYHRFLPRLLRPVLRVEDEEPGLVALRLPLVRTPLLLLRHAYDRSTRDRHLFVIEGGLLLRKGTEGEGRLEFREVLGGRALMAAIHDFAPALPWWIYHLTQARAHLMVMSAFARHLRARGASSR